MLNNWVQERDEGCWGMKRRYPDEGPKQSMQSPKNDSLVQVRNPRFNRTKLPHGWLDCPEHGQVISFIIPSKVPLDESFNDVVMPGKRYSSKQIIHQFGSKLGLVIDLTNSSRYYLLSDWKKQGIKHVKIPCKGRDAVPDNESVNLVVYEVMQFSSRQRHSKKFILVHCTHGHNRTGFMIIHYLMRSQPITVTEDDHMENEEMTNGDILGDAIPFDQQDAMRQFFYKSLKLVTGAKGNLQFPDHIRFLSTGCRGMKRRYPDEGPKQSMQSPKNDPLVQLRNPRFNRTKLPPW